MIPPSSFDLDQMALTLWAEARSEGELGIRAVAWVIRHRWENPRWWSRERGDGIKDDTIAAVCRDPYQFSCWSKGDRQSARLHNPATLKRVDVQRIRSLAQQVLEEDYTADPTNKADHYCRTDWVYKTYWARGKEPVAIVKAHSFFRLELKP